MTCELEFEGKLTPMTSLLVQCIWDTQDQCISIWDAKDQCISIWDTTDHCISIWDAKDHCISIWDAKDHSTDIWEIKDQSLLVSERHHTPVNVWQRCIDLGRFWSMIRRSCLPYGHSTSLRILDVVYVASNQVSELTPLRRQTDIYVDLSRPTASYSPASGFSWKLHRMSRHHTPRVCIDHIGCWVLI
jgi:hypothetical protein